MSTDAQRAYHRNWYQEHAEERRRASRDRMRDWRQTNPLAAKKANKKWRDKNPSHLKNYLLEKTYSITLAQRDVLFGKQGKKCAVCRSPTTGGRNWHVDHCHSTGRVRGILCNGCNLMIGHAKETPDILTAAAEYLKR